MFPCSGAWRPSLQVFATALHVHTAAWRNTAVRRWRKKSGVPVQSNSRRRRITTLKVKACQICSVNKRLGWYYQDRTARGEFVASWGLKSVIRGTCVWDEHEHEQHMMNQTDSWSTHSSDFLLLWSPRPVYSTCIDAEERFPLVSCQSRRDNAEVKLSRWESLSRHVITRPWRHWTGYCPHSWKYYSCILSLRCSCRLVLKNHVFSYVHLLQMSKQPWHVSSI